MVENEEFFFNFPEFKKKKEQIIGNGAKRMKTKNKSNDVKSEHSISK